MEIVSKKTRIFKPNENIYYFLDNYLPQLSEKNIVIITSKIIALAEGRLVNKKNEKFKNELIAEESDFVWPTKYVQLTIKNGQIMANAGIDESNGNKKLILLPKDSYQSAANIRKYLMKKFKLKNLGIIITDSHCLPLRSGTVGMALGYAGFCGLKDYTSKPDIFGRRFKYAKANMADSLAAAAVLCMGEGNEQRPLAFIYDAPVKFCSKSNKDELKIDIKDDIFNPLFKNLI